MDREIREPITLSDGTYLPKGVTVSANSWQITHDPEVLQSESDPRTFDGLRYYNMRNQLVKTGLDEKEVAGKHQFVSISNGSLMFGYGKHACPGRFFAGNEIKLILAKLLTTFDIKIDPVEKGRYANFSWEMSVSNPYDRRMFLICTANTFN
jgi:cytochrome P450